MSSPPLVTSSSFPPLTVLSPQSTAVSGTIPLDITSSPPPFSSSSSVVPTSTSPGGGDGGGSGGAGDLPGNTNLVNSASLYLYTFLATIILLLSVAGIITFRTCILRRRHQRSVAEAIRNGTYVPPTPLPIRPAHVDLSQKPQLWEAYLGGSEQLVVGSSGKKELDIGSTNWKSEYSIDWESIKPICAGYNNTEPLTSGIPYSGSTPNLTTSLSPPFSIPVSSPINPSTDRGNDEENGRTAEVTAGTTTTTTPSLFTRARILLNPNSTTTQAVPASSSADDGTNSHSNSANVSMTELRSNSPPPPTVIRVAVLIAMPSPSSSHGSLPSSTPPPRSASLISSKAQPTTSHPLELSSSSPSSSPTKTLRNELEKQPPLPHLEMGVADVVVMGRSENSSGWDSAHTTTATTRRRREKTNHSRGSSYAEP